MVCLFVGLSTLIFVFKRAFAFFNLRCNTILCTHQGHKVNRVKRETFSKFIDAQSGPHDWQFATLLHLLTHQMAGCECPQGDAYTLPFGSVRQAIGHTTAVAIHCRDRSQHTPLSVTLAIRDRRKARQQSRVDYMARCIAK